MLVVLINGWFKMPNGNYPNWKVSSAELSRLTATEVKGGIFGFLGGLIGGFVRGLIK